MGRPRSTTTVAVRHRRTTVERNRAREDGDGMSEWRTCENAGPARVGGKKNTKHDANQLAESACIEGGFGKGFAVHFETYQLSFINFVWGVFFLL